MIALEGLVVVLLVHVDEMVLGGEDKEVARVIDQLTKYKKMILVNTSLTTMMMMMMVNEKYAHDLVKMMSPLKKPSQEVELKMAAPWLKMMSGPTWPVIGQAWRARQKLIATVDVHLVMRS